MKEILEGIWIGGKFGRNLDKNMKKI